MRVLSGWVVTVALAAVLLAPGPAAAGQGAEPAPRERGRLMNACAGSTSPGYWLERLTDPDPAGRVRAAQALGEMRERSAVPALTGALGDQDPRVRAAAARALGRIGPRAATARPALERMLGDADPGVREAAARSLEQVRPRNPR